MATAPDVAAALDGLARCRAELGDLPGAARDLAEAVAGYRRIRSPHADSAEARLEALRGRIALRGPAADSGAAGRRLDGLSSRPGTS